MVFNITCTPCAWNIFRAILVVSDHTEEQLHSYGFLLLVKTSTDISIVQFSSSDSTLAGTKYDNRNFSRECYCRKKYYSGGCVYIHIHFTSSKVISIDVLGFNKRVCTLHCRLSDNILVHNMRWVS